MRDPSPSEKWPELTPWDVYRGAAAGHIPVGAVVLWHFAEPGWTSRLIAPVQRRLLADLHGKPRNRAEKALQSDAAGFTHAGMVFEPDGIVEMTVPRCRFSRWEEVLHAGDEILIRAPFGLAGDEDLGHRLRMAAAEDLGLAYPGRELLTYWFWSWPTKLWLSRHFRNVFRDPVSDVCSGRVWHWYRRAGLFEDVSEGDARPEAWYPARLAMDTARFRDVTRFTVGGAR